MNKNPTVIILRIISKVKTTVMNTSMIAIVFIYLLSGSSRGCSKARVKVDTKISRMITESNMPCLVIAAATLRKQLLGPNR